MQPQQSSTSRVGRVLLWVMLVLCLVVGGMFFAVAVTNSGDTETGGYMIALPAGLIAALCVYGLAHQRRPR